MLKFDMQMVYNF